MAELLADLIELYRGAKAESLYDESVTELEHALQCGALAERAGADAALVAAALLHDVGHLVVGDLTGIDAELSHDFHHERAGARLLTSWFGPDVTEPVRLHVAAKRYLCATDPDYVARLSPSSVRSLAVQVRQWDDEAKVAGLDVAPIEHYRPMLDALVR